MNVVIGIDVQPISEVEASIVEFGARYTRKLFTDHEIECCETNAGTSAAGLAARFAAKEAVLKILDTQESVPPWKTIEVHRTQTGKPEIVLSGEAAELAHSQGVEHLSLSISHGGGIAAAAVVAHISQCEVEAKR
jgi:holo-[acyl-carrier protein] synthase